MTDCIFCKVVSKKIPSRLIFENEKILCFEDIQPQAPVHLLVIPKKHIRSLDDLLPEDADLMGDIFSCIKLVTTEQGLAKAGFRTIINTNTNGGQTVFHLHAHVMGGALLGGNMAGR